MDETKILFLSTLDDLENRTESQDPYEILGISALVRKLLLDSYPLVDQVNREYRLKIRFSIVYTTGQLDQLEEMGLTPILWVVPDGLDMAPPGFPRQAMTRQRFLNTVILAVRGERYSIRDIVLFEANVMGGVHAGRPKNEREEVVNRINQVLTVHGYRASLQLLTSIGRVVLQALRPLRRAVEGTSATAGGAGYEHSG